MTRKKFTAAIRASLVLANLLMSCLVDRSAFAAVIRHWALDESSLPTNFSGSAGEVLDSTGNSSGGRFFEYATSSDLTGIIGVPGPAGFGTAYNFTEASAVRSGVFTNSLNAVPASGDFSIVVMVRTTDTQAAQGHLFSNNNAQAGRANLHIFAGTLQWFANGGMFDTNNDLVSDGDVIASPIGATTALFDGNWHEVALGRHGNRFDLALDGTVLASGVSLGNSGAGVVISQAQSWMIGRQRSNAGDFDGYIADVKVYDSYVVPEPSAALLLVTALGGCFAMRSSARKSERPGPPIV